MAPVAFIVVLTCSTSIECIYPLQVTMTKVWSSSVNAFGICNIAIVGLFNTIINFSSVSIWVGISISASFEFVWKSVACVRQALVWSNIVKARAIGSIAMIWSKCAFIFVGTRSHKCSNKPISFLSVPLFQRVVAVHSAFAAHLYFFQEFFDFKVFQNHFGLHRHPMVTIPGSKW